ncbi:Zinc-binding alcohol dehydrogenase domain-containing protein 2 [Choanephora cucurbitarum]|uniref:Zinc-binding alcohol dehydrogenase domain-containing protein 2 n=1 Tax=Choanephora cucurbitarum TaxID=101091 RepID=A0A1C7NRF4_9FUNG|nr:Zinc-binding alcohol dehydrogenase domain-containing protein 2 [Choanephora cucurbitarum]
MSKTTTFRKLQAFEVSNNFSKVTKLVTVNLNDMINNVKANSVIIKNHYVGINASDINFTNGKYIPGIKPPFDVGFEALGEIVAVGSKVSKDKIGTFVIYTQYGAFAEYLEISQRAVISIPSAQPEFLGLLTSGLTASIALEETGRMTKGETVLVTAAAGGAGQIAVQLAKLAGNHVIGTCSSDDKVAMLKEMGCDRVINYKKEDFKAVMKKEYPRGVDIIFESVGGQFFDICLKSLAVRGRLIVIGTLSTYAAADGMAGDNVNTLKLLGTSRTVAGFFMPDYKEFHAAHMAKMIKLVKEGKLKVLVDNGGLNGIEQVADGVTYLHSGKNKGKVVISLLQKSSKL